MNDQLFYSEPEEGVGDSQESLLSLVDDFDLGELRIPVFQRDFVWTKDQVKDWVDSILGKVAIGVIVTYQLKGGGSRYIADGRQRVTATSNFIKSPSEYGYSFNQEQARKYCKAFKITVQHRIYRDNSEALVSFQRLNRGTALTPLEFYSGFLTLSDNGKTISEKIPEIVFKRESHLVINQRALRKAGEHKLTRDAFALFLQYISETDQMSFWNVGSVVMTSTNEIAVETELSKSISSLSQADLEKKIANFDRFISSEIALADTINNRVGGKGHPIGYSVMRWVLHLAIWRKNTGRTVQDYEAFIEALFSQCVKSFGKVVSRVQWLDKETGLNKYCTLSSQSLTHLKELCVAFDSNLYTGRGNRKRESLVPGYQSSHLLPFSTHGDGETIPEPACLNMARGAKPVNRN